MVDRAWLPHMAAEHKFDWKAANSPTNFERAAAAAAAPVGFPHLIKAEMVWKGAEFQDRPGLYRCELNERHIEELEAAAMGFEGNQSTRLMYRIPGEGRLKGRKHSGRTSSGTTVYGELPSGHTRPRFASDGTGRGPWARLLRSPWFGPEPILQIQKYSHVCGDRLVCWE